MLWEFIKSFLCYLFQGSDHKHLCKNPVRALNFSVPGQTFSTVHKESQELENILSLPCTLNKESTKAM